MTKDLEDYKTTDGYTEMFHSEKGWLGIDESCFELIAIRVWKDGKFNYFKYIEVDANINHAISGVITGLSTTEMTELEALHLNSLDQKLKNKK